MANPKSIITTIEGVIGNALRFAADTANNVAQGADTWLKTVKKDLTFLDPATNVFFDDVALTATPATPASASTTMRLYGLIVRNQDNGVRFVRLTNRATVATDAGMPTVQIASVAVGTRAAANSPAYAFAAFPGGLDISQGVSATTLTLTAIATTTPAGATAATDVNAWFLYSA